MDFEKGEQQDDTTSVRDDWWGHLRLAAGRWLQLLFIAQLANFNSATSK